MQKISTRNTAPGAERLHTPQQVAERLQLSLRTIRRWIANGELAVHRFGRAVRVSEGDLSEFLRRTRG